MSDPKDLQGLNVIPILTSSDGWSKWLKAIINCLEINQFKDLLYENSQAPVPNPDETERELDGNGTRGSSSNGKLEQ